MTVAGKDGSNKGAFAFSSTNEDESAIQKLTVQANGSATVTAGDLTVSALDIQKGGAVSVTGGELSLDTLTIAQDSSNNPTGTFTLTSGDLSTSAANIYTLKKTADGTLDLVASGANKGAVQATLNKGLTLNGGNVWVSDETEWSAADYANLKTTMGSATLFFANGTFVSKDENGKTTGLGTLANLLTTGSTGTTGTLGEAYAAKSEIAAEHGTTTPQWDNLDKRVTLGSLTAVATAEDAKAMTSASFNGTGVLVLRGDANGDVFKNFTDKDGKALDIALNVNTFFGDEDGDAGVINNSLTASKQVTNNGDFTVNGKLTLSGTDTAGLNVADGTH